jgi:DNA-binding transcriptional MerR regulator
MLTIGEFSKLSHVSSRMLRYYDSMGLLCPVHMGKENGYRYYDALQLNTLLKIESLKQYGSSPSRKFGICCHFRARP